jgi:drug/metabolite transporter (DMT)-like permease
MTRRGLWLFAAMCVIWGIPYLLIRVSVKEISPATLVLARTGIAAALLLPIAAYRRELRPVLSRWLPLLVFTAIEIALPWVLLGAAEQHVSSSLTGLLIAAVPLVGALVARTTGTRERFGLQTGAGLLLGLSALRRSSA